MKVLQYGTAVLFEVLKNSNSLAAIERECFTPIASEVFLMDASNELKSLDYARKNMIPRRTDGKPVNPSTVWRWIRNGLEGLDGERITLAVTYAGSRPCVTAKDVDEFFAAVTEAKLERHRIALERRSDVSEAELDAAGLL